MASILLAVFISSLVLYKNKGNPTIMRFYVILFFVSMLLPVYAQSSPKLNPQLSPNPSRVEPLASQSLLLDIIRIGENKLIAVGERGHIILSDDGQTWQQANVPVQATLTAVYFVDQQHGWAVGHDATILVSVDGGQTWQIQQYLPETEKPLLDVLFFNQKQGVAIGAYGMFYRTDNGGETWRIEYHNELLFPEDQDYLDELKQEDEEAYLDEQQSILPHFNRIIYVNNKLYMVGEIGLIAASEDFGQHWQKLEEVYTGSFYDIKLLKNGDLLASGLRGHLFVSADQAKTWQKIVINSTALLNSIVVAEQKKLYVLGNNGVLLVSEDNGKTFQMQIQKDGKNLINGVWYRGKIIAVSDVGIKTITIAK